MKTITITQKSDIIGSLASGLCLIHCLATPFLFAAHANHIHEHHHHSHPFWWGLLDILFIGISFFAVLWSVRNTSSNWMKFALWISWSLLAFVILNEKLQLVFIPELFIFVPSILLVVFHLYNKKYCQCNNEDCCKP